MKFASIAWVAVGYLLRRSGAEAAAHGFPVHMPADSLTGGGIRTGVRLYGVAPPCIRERVDGAEHSTMPENYALIARWPRKDELRPLTWFLHRAKWRLIHFYQKCNPFAIV